MSDWLALLRARVAEIGVSATARELGVSHGSVSTLIHEKYPGDTWRMADRVMKRYARNPCPYNGEMVSYHDCARYAGKVPTSSPAALRRWRACQKCTFNGMEVGQIINNMRNEIKVLASAEEAAFHLWLSHQYAKKYTKVHWEELPNM